MALRRSMMDKLIMINWHHWVFRTWGCSDRGC